MNADHLKILSLFLLMTKMPIAPVAVRVHRGWWQVPNWPFWMAAYAMPMKPTSAARTSPGSLLMVRVADAVLGGVRKLIRVLYIVRMDLKVFPKSDPG